MAKNIDFEIGFKDKGAKAGFDGIEVSSKELQTRIAQLDAQMKKLIETEGRAASSSKTYEIIQRERRFALNELISLEEKSGVAIQRNTRGLGSLASAAMAASGSISGLGTGVSTLTNALMSGVGLTGALGGAVVGFSLLMEYMRKSSEEAKKLAEQIKSVYKSLFDIQQPGGKFNIEGKDLASTIAKLRGQLGTPSGLSTSMSGQEIQNLQEANAQIFKKNAAIYNTIGLLEEELKIYNRIQEGVEILTELGLSYTEKQNKGLKEQAEIYEDITKSLDFMIKHADLGIEMLPDLTGEQMRMPGGGLRKIPGKPNDLAYQQMPWYKEREKLEREFITSTASVMREELGGAWEDIFGEANSMFEKLISRWAESLLMNIGTNFLTGFVGGIIPGFGDLFSFSRLTSKGNATAARYGMGN